MRKHLDIALARFRETGDRWGLTATLNAMAGLFLLEEDLDGAAAALDEAQALLAELGADAEHAFLHMRLADVRQRQGDEAGALWHARRARDATDLGGSEAAMAGAAMARILWLAGEREEARAALDQALVTLDRTAEGRRDRGHLDAIVRGSAAMIELDGGNVAVARGLLEAAFPVAVGTDDLPVVGMVGLAVVGLALAERLPRDAAEALGAAARLRGSTDATNIDVVELTTRLRDELGDDGFTAAFEAGRALDRDAAIARLDPQTLRR